MQKNKNTKNKRNNLNEFNSNFKKGVVILLMIICMMLLKSSYAYPFDKITEVLQNLFFVRIYLLLIFYVIFFVAVSKLSLFEDRENLARALSLGLSLYTAFTLKDEYLQWIMNSPILVIFLTILFIAIILGIETESEFGSVIKYILISLLLLFALFYLYSYFTNAGQFKLPMVGIETKLSSPSSQILGLIIYAVISFFIWIIVFSSLSDSDSNFKNLLIIVSTGVIIYFLHNMIKDFFFQQKGHPIFSIITVANYVLLTIALFVILGEIPIPEVGGGGFSTGGSFRWTRPSREPRRYRESHRDKSIFVPSRRTFSPTTLFEKLKNKTFPYFKKLKREGEKIEKEIKDVSKTLDKAIKEMPNLERKTFVIENNKLPFILEKITQLKNKIYLHINKIDQILQEIIHKNQVILKSAKNPPNWVSPIANTLENIKNYLERIDSLRKSDLQSALNQKYVPINFQNYEDSKLSAELTELTNKVNYLLPGNYVINNYIEGLLLILIDIIVVLKYQIKEIFPTLTNLEVEVLKNTNIEFREINENWKSFLKRYIEIIEEMYYIKEDIKEIIKEIGKKIEIHDKKELQKIEEKRVKQEQSLEKEKNLKHEKNNAEKPIPLGPPTREIVPVKEAPIVPFQQKEKTLKHENKTTEKPIPLPPPEKSIPALPPPNNANEPQQQNNQKKEEKEDNEN